jgi:hypothetical protein
VEQRLQDKGDKYADSILKLFGPRDFLNITLEEDFSEHAIQALEDRGCVVQRELGSRTLTVYILPNHQAFRA